MTGAGRWGVSGGAGLNGGCNRSLGWSPLWGWGGGWEVSMVLGSGSHGVGGARSSPWFGGGLVSMVLEMRRPLSCTGEEGAQAALWCGAGASGASLSCLEGELYGFGGAGAVRGVGL